MRSAGGFGEAWFGRKEVDSAADRRGGKIKHHLISSFSVTLPPKLSQSDRVCPDYSNCKSKVGRFSETQCSFVWRRRIFYWRHFTIHGNLLAYRNESLTTVINIYATDLLIGSRNKKHKLLGVAWSFRFFWRRSPFPLTNPDLSHLKPWFYVKVKLFYRILVFYFNMEPRLKWNKIVLAAKIILFHFRPDVWNEIKLF